MWAGPIALALGVLGGRYAISGLLQGGRAGLSCGLALRVTALGLGLLPWAWFLCSGHFSAMADRARKAVEEATRSQWAVVGVVAEEGLPEESRDGVRDGLEPASAQVPGWLDRAAELPRD